MHHYIQFFITEERTIIDFFEEELKNAFDKEKYYEEYIELSEILDWVN